MFYNFEKEEEKKELYECSSVDLSSLSEEELLSVGAVYFHGHFPDEEDGHNFAKYLSRLKEKTSNLENITILKSTESIFTPEVVLQLAECFPYVKTFRICGWGCSTFAPGAIKSFQYFKNLRTLKIHNYDARDYFQLQEFGTLKQLKYLIIDYTWNGAYNFESLAFLKEMNLDKIEIEGVISVYNPAVNDEFNASILNNKKLQQKKRNFQKIVSKAAPGNKSSIEAAEGFFTRGMIDKGIEYLYMYGATKNPEQNPPFTISKSADRQDILLFKWENRDWLTIEYFNKRPFLKKLYPNTEVELDDFNNVAFYYKYPPALEKIFN
jgi:hypothetical protein